MSKLLKKDNYETKNDLEIYHDIVNSIIEVSVHCKTL